MNNRLDLKEQLGQTILLGLDVYEINDEIIRIIKDFKIGGVVLYKKNYTSLETMTSFVNKLKEINKDNKVPLFIAIDQENGRVNRLPSEVTRIKNSLAQAKTQNMDIIKAVNSITCQIIKSVGVNMNFAPVLDIARNEKSKAIGNRSYGSNSADVIKYALPFMKEMQKNNIISVVKHFPGHGATDKDSHFRIPKINDITKLEKEDIQVFKNAFNNGADAVMIGHLKLKGFGMKPASFNKEIIQKYLSNFNGLIITDDLRMNFMASLFGLKNCIKDSLNAGNNVVMVKYHKGDYGLYRKLLKMVEHNKIDPKMVASSAQKIINYKQKYNIVDKQITNKLDVKLINIKIKEINELIDKELTI